MSFEERIAVAQAATAEYNAAMADVALLVMAHRALYGDDRLISANVTLVAAMDRVEAARAARKTAVAAL